MKCQICVLLRKKKNKFFLDYQLFFFRNKFFFSKKQLLFNFLCIVRQKKISEWSKNFWKKKAWHDMKCARFSLTDSEGRSNNSAVQKLPQRHCILPNYNLPQKLSDLHNSSILRFSNIKKQRIRRSACSEWRQPEHLRSIVTTS